MKNSVFSAESTLTDEHQTTIPSAVLKALNLSKHEKIRYTILTDSSVLLTRVDHDETDPVIDSFLHFLAENIQNHPEHLQAITHELKAHMKGLIKGLDIDIDAPLNDEDKSG